MQYRQLGPDLRVSVLSLGTLTFGGGDARRAGYGGLDQREARELVAQALDAGINLFDTADLYVQGESEILLGQALAGRRHDAVISTKVGMPVGPGPGACGLSPAHIQNQVESSLRRLGTDYIDIYWMHLPDPATPLDETVPVFDRLVRQGKIRTFGLSNYHAWELSRALLIAAARGVHRPVGMQAYYNLVARDIEREIIPLLQDQGLGLLVWGALAGGALAAALDPDAVALGPTRRKVVGFPPVPEDRLMRLAPVLAEIARERQVGPAAVALAWLVTRPGVSSVLFGARSRAQLEQNLSALALVLDAPALDRLQAASAMPEEYPAWLQRHMWQRFPRPGQKTPG